MLLSQELSDEGATEMVGKRLTEVWELEAGPVAGAGPTGLEAGSVEEEVETTGEAGPVEPGSGERTSRDRRLRLPSSEEGFRRVVRRPPAIASSMSPSSNRRALS